MEVIYHDQVNEINFIKNAQYYIAKVQKAEKNVLLSPTVDEKEEHIMHLEKCYSSGIIGSLSEFKKTSHEDDMKQIDLLIEDIGKVKEQQLDAINKSISLKNNEALLISKDNDKKFTAVTLIISILLAITISSSIINPLKKSVDFAKDLANGNLTSSLKIKSTDEIGVLINSLNNTGMKLKDIVTQIKSTSSEVTLGSEQLASAMESTTKTSTEIVEKISNSSHNIQDIVTAVGAVNKSI